VSELLNLGYDLDAWNTHGAKIPVGCEISPTTNSMTVFCGMSGSGKTTLLHSTFRKIYELSAGGICYFADYKGDDTFSYLRGCPRYYTYKRTTEALEIVYSRLTSRLSGEDESRYPITLVWEEYVANILSLINSDKKYATEIMQKVAEILMLGRSMRVRIICSCQRPDAAVFPTGSRLNYGLIVVLGSGSKSIYDMIVPDFIEQIKGRSFGTGEGVAVLQGSKLHFIKVPLVSDVELLMKSCIKALS
jgi:energy-coupling factor transporter ATP-binding protein EcfA2